MQFVCSFDTPVTPATPPSTESNLGHRNVNYVRLVTYYHRSTCTYPRTRTGPTSPLEFNSSLTATFKCVWISYGGKGKGKDKGKGKGEVITNHAKRQKLGPYADISS
jgi:hypothetical protein